MNKVILIGRSVADCELKKSGEKEYCRFCIAIDRFAKDNKTTDFVDCVAFGKSAEVLGKYVAKGDRIGIEGSIRTSVREVEGKNLKNTDVIVDRVELLGNKKNTDEFVPF